MEALEIEHQEEVQVMHFGGNVSASTEGQTCHFPCSDDETKILSGFHSFLPDDLQEVASTVGNHSKKLVKSLKGNMILKEGRRISGSVEMVVQSNSNVQQQSGS